MDKIINWFLLIIIFVFDPLAISLVIAANFAFNQVSKKKPYQLTEEDKEWLDAPLINEEIYDEPNENLKQAVSTYKQRMIDSNGDGIVDESEFKDKKASLARINVHPAYIDKLNKAYKKYYRKQESNLIEENRRMLEIVKLEKEQEIMRFKNEQLVQEFENKNRELATSTMTLIKKNELLAQIKDELKKYTDSEPNKNVKSVINTINKNINEEDTWNVFKDAFNNVDKDFLKKIKKLHPSLTPNDLRLCAYLRLNLSSKEIAPLLNISVRSVEIKRYRLRKKMELEHEQGLVEYILAI
jgi:DNA-binding CsgD family transcriptional regulator